MTFLATLFGAAFGLYDLRFQPDLFSDVIKISGLLALSSACASYIFWTLTHLNKDSVFRGGLAGLLAGAAIVQVPFFASTLKAEVLRLHNTEGVSLVMSIFTAIPVSLKNGMATFQVISKVSLAAVLSSIILGLVIARYVPPRAETDLGRL